MNTLYMRFIVFGFILFIYSCGNKKTEVTNENVVQKDSLVKIDLTNSENKIIYVPSNIKVLDTTLFSNRNFSKFRCQFSQKYDDKSQKNLEKFEINKLPLYIQNNLQEFKNWID